MLSGKILMDYDPDAARVCLDAAAAAYEELGVSTLAKAAREIAHA